MKLFALRYVLYLLRQFAFANSAFKMRDPKNQLCINQTIVCVKIIEVLNQKFWVNSLSRYMS